MKKIGAVLLCLLLCMSLLPLPHAAACIFPTPVMRPSASGGGNEKAVKIRAGELIRGPSYSRTYPHTITQTAMPFVRVLPNGKATVPLTVGIKFYNDHEHDGKTRRERMSIRELKEEGLADPAVTVNNDVLYVALDLNDRRYQEYQADKLVNVEGYESYGTIRFKHAWNGYGIQNDLALALPETPGITVDLASTPQHLVLRLAAGTPLPAMTAFQAEYGGKKVRIQERLGFFTQGRSKTFLPVSDAQTLAQYPELKNACLLTFMVFDKREKTTRYAVVEARWEE